MSWVHRVVFGGSCEDIAPELEKSYQEYGCSSSSVQTDETCMETITSERGWGHEQTDVMTTAYTEGKISWWQRFTERG